MEQEGKPIVLVEVRNGAHRKKETVVTVKVSGKGACLNKKKMDIARSMFHKKFSCGGKKPEIDGEGKWAVIRLQGDHGNRLVSYGRYVIFGGDFIKEIMGEIIEGVIC